MAEIERDFREKVRKEVGRSQDFGNRARKPGGWKEDQFPKGEEWCALRVI
jgi:hypothetical protein